MKETRGEADAGPLVAGLGQCCWDCLARVAVYPKVDSKEELLDWHEEGGGPVATALVALARLGHPCRFAGVVGDDDLGTRIRSSLVEEGIDTAFLLTRTGAASQRAFIAIEEGSARRTIFWQRPTGEALRPAELSPGFLDDVALLLLDGLMPEASLHAARLARERGIPTMLDAGRNRASMLDLARLCDYVVAGEQFFLDLGWDGSRAQFAALAKDLGSAVVGVTLGERGSLTWDGEGLIQTPALPVKAVDTTGAGDVFHGALASGILRGLALPQALAFASAAAALACTAVGGRSGIAGLREIETLLGGERAATSNSERITPPDPPTANAKGDTSAVPLPSSLKLSAPDSHRARQ